ncbi:Cyclin N-terminal domain-containing protein [Heracleum sosnowskyi]|uniref:Cyclin N-terminal domain-containing protein n=1 Tax=Heracleum sosnowskyi TaxID=360622 RepID=A0AAD8JHG5_9APIA|nr:Cyclin N-terminal domain-containing protein [Heracleum sosnowskyi]
MNVVKQPAKIYNTKKGSSTNIVKAKQSAVVPKKNPAMPACDEILSRIVVPSGPCSMDLSLDQSDNLSVSMDESVSTCDSLKSPEVEYIDKSNVADIDSIERKTCDKLHISDHVETGNTCKRDILAEMEASDKIVDADDQFTDPQMCASMACDIYKHLRASEVKKRPSVDFMEKVQKNINISIRAILVDWLVQNIGLFQILCT